MSEKIYKYYSTMRPFDIGTFPKDYVELNNYDERKQVLPGIMAYGEITFNRKLSEEEMKYYELTEDVNKEEALQDIKNLDKINEVLLNKKFYDKGICSIIKKMSELIQKEKEKKAYKSDISKKEYKNVTLQKHIIELDQEEAIRYYADKIVYDCITDYWRINRQVSDLQRDLNDAVKRNKYWSAITMAQWEKGIDDLISAQSSVSKTIPQKNKLFIDFLMKMKLKEKPQYFVHFMNTDEEDSGFLDFEHIIPKKIIQTHIKDLSVSQQNLFSVSSIGNLCYLTVTDNRAKREKTIYEFKENRPSYSYDMDYLSFIEYPAEDDIVFMKYPNIEFRQGYERFINNRMEKLRVEFLRLIRKTYFEHQ